MASFLDKIKIKFNKNFKKNYEEFLIFKDIINDFIVKYGVDTSNVDYFDNNSKKDIIEKNTNSYEICSYLKNFEDFLEDDELDLINSYIETYENFDENISKINTKYIDNFYKNFSDSKDKIKEFIDILDTNVSYDNLINKNELVSEYNELYELTNKLIEYKSSDNYKLKDEKLINEFREIYSNLDKIVNEINDEVTYRDNLFKDFEDNFENMLEFIETYDKNISSQLFIKDYHEILDMYSPCYDVCLKVSEIYESEEITNFIEIYENFEVISQEINENYLNNHFDKILSKKEKIEQFCDKYKYNIDYNKEITNSERENDFHDFKSSYDISKELMENNFDLKDDYKLINDFIEVYENLYKIVDEINKECSHRLYLIKKYCDIEFDLLKFISKYKTDSKKDFYIENYKLVLNNYSSQYLLCKELSSFDVNIEKNIISQFINIYENFEEISSNINQVFIDGLKLKFNELKQDIIDFNNKFGDNICYCQLIDTTYKNQIKSDLRNAYDLSNDIVYYHIEDFNLELISKFIALYDNFDEIVNGINKEYSKRLELQNQFDKNKAEINQFILKYGNNASSESYIKNKNEILNKYHSQYVLCKKIVDLDIDLNKEIIRKFILIYDNFDNYVSKINKNYLNNVYNDFLDIKEDLINFNNKFKLKISYTQYINNNEKVILKNKWQPTYLFLNEFLRYSEDSNYKILQDNLIIIQSFVEIYCTFDKVISDINNEYKRRNRLHENYFMKETNIKEFITKYRVNGSSNDYINNYYDILNKYSDEYKICKDLDELNEKFNEQIISKFIDLYENFDKVTLRINKKFIDILFKEFLVIEYRLRSFCDIYKYNIEYNGLIDDKTKNGVFLEYENDYSLSKKLLSYIKSDNYEISEDRLNLLNDFKGLYSNFDDVINKINVEYNRIIELHNLFHDNKKLILNFISKYKTNISQDLYIENYKQILKENKSYYENCRDLKEIDDKSNYDLAEDKEIIFEFIDLFDNFREIATRINENYISRKYENYLDLKSQIKSDLVNFKNLDSELYINSKNEFLNRFNDVVNLLMELKKIKKDLSKSDLDIINDYFELYNKFESYVDEFKSLFSKNKQVLTKIMNKYQDNLPCTEYILDKETYLKKYDKNLSLATNALILHENNELQLKDSDLKRVNDFLSFYHNFDEIILKINACYIEKLQKQFLDKKDDLNSFVKTYNSKSILDEYIDDKSKNKILKDNKKLNDFVMELFSRPVFINKSKKRDLNLIHKFQETYQNFDNVVTEMNKKYVNNLFRENKSTIAQYSEIVNLHQNFYISQTKLHELLENHKSAYQLVKDLLNFCKDYDYLKDTSVLEEFPKSKTKIKNNYKKANEAFIKKELRYKKRFFDDINGLSLDNQQRNAVIIDEDTTHIIAGAGTGKTLTLQAKIKYLIEKRDVNPEEIIALSYSNASVDDLKSKIDEDIDIKTIHSLGNQILNEHGKEPDTDDDAINYVLDDYFLNRVMKNEKKSQRVVDFYSYFRYVPIDLDDISTKGELYDKEAGRDFESLKSKSQKVDYSENYVTFNREYVKSLEELFIANFLYIHGVEYEYERIYKVKTDEFKLLGEFIQTELDLPIKYLNKFIKEIAHDLNIEEESKPEDLKYIRYKPDFYLPEYDIYLEHFGVDRNCQAGWLNKSDAKKYHDSIIWKRGIHEKYGTKLLETYSYYQSENRLLKRLEEKLKDERVIFNPVSYKELYQRLIDQDNLKKLTDLIKLIKTFINHFKGNNMDKSEFKHIRKLIDREELKFIKTRHILLYNIIKDVYELYQKYLEDNRLIDYNDMINKSCESIDEKGCPLNYKYILVDEYQDVSYMRYSLLRKIQDETNSKIVVVGDDWQSIYRFSGCDVGLFTQISEYYENVETRLIEKTYRNSQELIEVSGSFVMENPNQIKKELISDKSIENPIKIAYYDSDPEEIFLFKKLIDNIIDNEDYDGSEILVLGRNKRDIQRLVKGKYFADEIFTYYGDIDTNFNRNKRVDVIYKKHEDIKITYRTIHGSKGLEASNVIVINLRNGFNGFPNKIEDDPILKYVKLNDEEFEFAEERRLFYVALTRTKGNCYLLSPKLNKSEFIEELEEIDEHIEYIHDSFIEEIMNSNNVDSSKYISYPTKMKCPECKTGDVILKFNNENSFFTCSQNHCDWVGGNFSGELDDLNNIFTCPKCGDMVVKRSGSYGPFFSCTNNFCDYIMEDISDPTYKRYDIDLDCPDCGEKLVFYYSEENNKGVFTCSNCEYDGGRFYQDVDDLEIHGICPDCEGVLVKKSGKYGEFVGCARWKRNRSGCNFSYSIH